MEKRLSGLIVGWSFGLFVPWLLDYIPNSIPAVVRLVVVAAYGGILLALTARAVRGFDEMMRRVAVESMAFGLATTLVVIMGMAEMGQVGWIPEPTVQDAYFAMIALTVTGFLVSWRRYR